MNYNNTKKYSICIKIELIKKVLRGLLFSLFFLKTRHLVAIGKNVTIVGKKNEFIVGRRVKIESGVFIQSVSKNGVI